MILPPLDLAVEVIDAAGVRTMWHPGDKLAGNRPQGMGFSTKRGEGFADGSVTLARRIDRDYVDLNLFDDVSFFGADGSTAYEGRIGAQPRSFGDTHSISVQLAGWMSHARDRPFTAIYVDRDLSAWQPAATSRQVTLMASSFNIADFNVTRDTSNSVPALSFNIKDDWVSPYKPIVEALYDCGAGNTATTVWIQLQGTSGSNSGFEFYLAGGPSENTFDVSTADLWAGTNTAAYYSLSAGRRYLMMEYTYGTTPSGATGAAFTLFAANVMVIGDSGLSLIGATNPLGVAASDVIKDIAGRYCPLLNTGGVQQTNWPIPHLVFKEATDPYDAFAAVNAYHLWEIGVWENKTLTYGPANRSDYDWEVRLSDLGVTVDLQGDSTEDLANGIIVDFTDVSIGAKNTLFPSTTTDLQDPNPLNPATRHGLQRWTKLSLSSPTTSDAAVQIGRAALTEFNAPKAPGTITVTGHLRDRAGHWQQGWKVRAGDTISITDHPNDTPRLVTETSWNHDSKQVTITVDSAAKRLDAVLDRIGLALSSQGLSS